MKHVISNMHIMRPYYQPNSYDRVGGWIGQLQRTQFTVSFSVLFEILRSTVDTAMILSLIVT